ncbi:MAG: hypothetical protein ACK47B_28730 [Armatimonadota bacterium]
MNESAQALFSAIADGIYGPASLSDSLVSDVEKFLGGEKLSPEQRLELRRLVSEHLEGFGWFLLGQFDNVGCGLPEGVLGYRIVAKPSKRRADGEVDSLPEEDIREEYLDYADMWLDYVAGLPDRAPQL